MKKTMIHGRGRKKKGLAKWKALDHPRTGEAKPDQ